MKLRLKIVLSFISLFPWNISAQYVEINEVSLGINEGEQYVEFLVSGNYSCAGFPVYDIRGVIFDDNNGIYSQGSSNGISPGSLRFANNSFWENIPVTTLIVIYNELNKNPAIPADDISVNDGNNRLILPANSPLIEGQPFYPNSTNSQFSATGWVAGGGKWSYIYLDSDGDTFQATPIVDDPNSGHAFSFISWGNNNFNASANYYNEEAEGRVYYREGQSFADFSVSALTHQTPGDFNSPGNMAYFESMNYPPDTELDLSMVITNESCAGACDGELHVVIANQQLNHSYVWNVPGTSNTLTGLCPGYYEVFVTNELGCTGTASATVQPAADFGLAVQSEDETCSGECDGFAEVVSEDEAQEYTFLWSDGSTQTDNVNLCPGDYSVAVSYGPGCVRDFSFTIEEGISQEDISFITTGPFELGQGPVQLENTIPGGTYSTPDCSQCLTSGGIFDPLIAGNGTYTICYTLINQGCTFKECAEFTVQGCLPEQTTESVKICEGDSILVFGSYRTQQDIYTEIFTSAEGCDSTHTVTLSYYPFPDLSISFSFCEEDSVLVYGEWIDSAAIYYFETQSANGCLYQQKVSVEEVFCPEEVILYIPNAFTPNDDMVNDVFIIEILGGEVLEGFIFNRWGEIVTSFDKENLSWDGITVSGENAPDGVYSYMIRYSHNNVVNQEKTGHITLLR